MTALRTLLPAARGDHDGPASGVVFKVERGPGGERVAYVRLRSGSVRLRDRIHLGPDRDADGHRRRRPPAARGAGP